MLKEYNFVRNEDNYQRLLHNNTRLNQEDLEHRLMTNDKNRRKRIE
jgi:hypothetical protein